MKTETAKHTPGPWEARDYKTREGDIWVDCNAFANKGRGRCLGGTVATILKCGSGNHLKANARLIAAAPELLEASKKLLHWMITRGYEGIGEVGLIKAAIAKAEAK